MQQSMACNYPGPPGHSPVGNMRVGLDTFDMTEADGPRALLTDRERAAVREDPDMNPNTRSTHFTNIQRKIPKLREDMMLLQDHQPEYYEQAYANICEASMSDRVDELESQVQVLNRRLDAVERLLQDMGVDLDADLTETLDAARESESESESETDSDSSPGSGSGSDSTTQSESSGEDTS